MVIVCARRAGAWMGVARCTSITSVRSWARVDTDTETIRPVVGSFTTVVKAEGGPVSMRVARRALAKTFRTRRVAAAS